MHRPGAQDAHPGADRLGTQHRRGLREHPVRHPQQRSGRRRIQAQCRRDPAAGSP